MTSSKLDPQVIIDGLGQGILLFASDGRLIQSNRMAATILGTDLNVIRTEGWPMLAGLSDAGFDSPDEHLDHIRSRALEAEGPVRFRMFRSGQYVPCWATALTGDDGEMYTLITMDVPDWGFITNVIDRFRDEMRDTVGSTIGHINLINRTLDSAQNEAQIRLGKRLGGFTRLISVHMYRAERLMALLERLEDVRTATVRDRVRADRRRVNVADFVEDFIEELDEIQLLDPETEPHDYRSRLNVVLDDDLALHVSRRYLTYTLQELLRNAIMYSLRGTPITFRAHAKNHNVQIDVIDEGYGVRQQDWDRVFRPFERARQPQIISEFGYGLSLHLCKHEIEAMSGRMWFISEEGVGSTFSVMLPAWRAEAAIVDEVSAVGVSSSSETHKHR